MDKTKTLSARDILNRFSHVARKQLGQNFLLDPVINQRIVSNLGDLKGKKILEIGPGPGGLTVELLSHQLEELYLVELDKRWIDAWTQLKTEFDLPITIIEADILQFDLSTINPSIVVSNLPYNVSTAALSRLWHHFHSYEQLLLMFQKEVADRICAQPNSKDYGGISVISQWLSDVKKIQTLEAGSFFPAPKIKSTVVKFTPRKITQTDEMISNMQQMLNSCFSQRRKKVIKALEKLIPNAHERLAQLGYSLDTRAEQISVEDFVKLCLEKQSH